MKKFILEKLQIENFLSIRDPLVWDFRKGLILLTGQNQDTGSSNGSGKSTLFEALFWVLYGETLRDLSNNRQISHFEFLEDPTIVSLEFKVQTNTELKKYKIIRSSNPGTLYLECEGENISGTSIIKTNEKIINILQMQPETFKNCVLLSQTGSVPFLAQKKTLRRKFIEGIFGLHILDTMAQLIKNQLLEHKREHKSQEQSYSEAIKSLEQTQNRLDQHILHTTSLLKDLNEHITKILNRIKEIEKIQRELNILEDSEETATLSQLQQQLDLLKSKKEELTSLFNETSFYKKTAVLKIQSLKDQINCETCLTCKRPFSKEHFSHLEEQIKEQEQVVQKIEKTQNQVQKALEKLQSKLSIVQENFLHSKIKIQDKKNKIRELENEKQMLKSDLQLHKNRILADKQLIQQLKNDVFSWKEKVLKIEEEMKKIVFQIEIETQAQDLLKQDSGIKTFLVKKILETLNNCLFINLQSLGLPYKIVFDEFFEETTLDMKGNQISYASLSSGERKRADLAILFTFQEILLLQSGVSWNCAFYDELLDGALDNEGIKNAIQVLRHRSEKFDQGIYLITHSGYIDQGLFDEVKCIVKCDGKSSWK